MAFPTITETHGAFVTYALPRDAAFGEPVPASTFLPASDAAFVEDPGWFSPHLSTVPSSDPTALTTEEARHGVPDDH